MGSLCVPLIILISFFTCSQGQLRFGFYENTCPKVEEVVAFHVREAFFNDPTMAAVLLRLHFHDCFIQGCDGSILIDGPDAEKTAFGHQGVRGFEVIEKAKAQLERDCPGVVSCADIVALAARDAITVIHGPGYQVQTGRKDGRVSNTALADDLPEVDQSIQSFKKRFLERGLSVKDLVLLSGAHTIGTTACFFLTDRLYNFPGFGSDPSINPILLPDLMAICPKNGENTVRLGMDPGSEEKFDDEILRNIKAGFAVLESDAKLYADPETKRIIDSYLRASNSTRGPSFENDFANSMVKMGRIGVKTGSEGEIRRVCNAFN